MDRMLRMLSVHSKKANKQSKKPVKVVYIANPMKVNTSAAEFRALVQQLTGQDAKYPTIESSVGSRGTECDRNGKFQKGFYLSESPRDKDLQVVHEDHHHAVDGVAPNSEAAMTDNLDLSFQDFGGEDFVPELLDNLPGLMASNLWYD